MGMTRQEFIDDVTTWYELLEFCYDEDCNICEDIVDSDMYDEYIDDELYDKIRNSGDKWWEIKDWLNGIPTGYDYYDRYNECGVDEYDFDHYKDDVLDWGDSNEVWDEDEEEEEDFEEDFDEEEDEELEEIDYNGFFDENFESTQGSYVRVTVEVSESESQKSAKPEPEPEPEFGSIEELLKPAF